MLPFDIKYALFGAALIATFFTGWTVHGWKYDAELSRQLQHENELKQNYDNLTRGLVKRYLDLQQNTVLEYRKIKERIPNVTDNRVCFDDSAALSVWNAALNGVSSAPAGAVATPGGTSATDREILSNATENFEQYASCRKQLNGLIDWYEQIQKVDK